MVARPLHGHRGRRRARPCASPTAWRCRAATATSTPSSGGPAVALSRALRAAQERAPYGVPAARWAAMSVLNAEPGPRARLPRPHLARPRRGPGGRRGPDPGGGAGRHHAPDRQHADRLRPDPSTSTAGTAPRPRPPRRGAADAAHHDEVQDPPGHRDPGRPPLRRLGDGRRGPARRRRPAGRRARPHRRRHQRRPPRDVHDRRRARLGRDRHQRRRRPPGAPRRHGHPHRLRPDGDRRGQGAQAARGLRRRRQQGDGHRLRPRRDVRRQGADPRRPRSDR